MPTQQNVVTVDCVTPWDAVKKFVNSLPNGALKFTISNDDSDPVIKLPSIDSGFITKSLNTDSLISCE